MQIISKKNLLLKHHVKDKLKYVINIKHYVKDIF